MKNRLAWALVLAAGLGLGNLLAIWLLGLPWRKPLSDALLLEGAVLMVAGGLMDLGRSITVSHILTLGRRRVGDPPPPVRKPGLGYVFILAGGGLGLAAALLVAV